MHAGVSLQSPDARSGGNDVAILRVETRMDAITTTGARRAMIDSKREGPRR
jgi:hypothetical protein